MYNLKFVEIEKSNGSPRANRLSSSRGSENKISKLKSEKTNLEIQNILENRKHKDYTNSPNNSPGQSSRKSKSESLKSESLKSESFTSENPNFCTRDRSSYYKNVFTQYIKPQFDDLKIINPPSQINNPVNPPQINNIQKQDLMNLNIDALSILFYFDDKDSIYNRYILGGYDDLYILLMTLENLKNIKTRIQIILKVDTNQYISGEISENKDILFFLSQNESKKIIEDIRMIDSNINHKIFFIQNSENLNFISVSKKLSRYNLWEYLNYIGTINSMELTQSNYFSQYPPSNLFRVSSLHSEIIPIGFFEGISDFDFPSALKKQKISFKSIKKISPHIYRYLKKDRKNCQTQNSPLHNPSHNSPLTNLPSNNSPLTNSPSNNSPLTNYPSNNSSSNNSSSNNSSSNNLSLSNSFPNISDIFLQTSGFNLLLESITSQSDLSNFNLFNNIEIKQTSECFSIHLLRKIQSPTRFIFNLQGKSFINSDIYSLKVSFNQNQQEEIISGSLFNLTQFVKHTLIRFTDEPIGLLNEGINQPLATFYTLFKIRKMLQAYKKISD